MPNDLFALQPKDLFEKSPPQDLFEQEQPRDLFLETSGKSSQLPASSPATTPQQKPPVAGPGPTSLNQEDEKEFLKQFKERNRRVEAAEPDPLGRKLSDDPDSPFQFFNAREEFLALRERGERLGDQFTHGSSPFKTPGHPTQFGFDDPSNRAVIINRITNRPATEQDFVEADKARKAAGLEVLPRPDRKRSIGATGSFGFDLTGIPEVGQRLLSAASAAGTEFVKGATLDIIDPAEIIPELKDLNTRFNQNIPVNEADPLFDKIVTRIQNNPNILAEIPARLVGELLSIGKISRGVTKLKGMPTTIKELMKNAAITGGIVGILRDPGERETAVQALGMRVKKGAETAVFFAGITGITAGVFKAVDIWRSGKPKALSTLREEMYKTFIDKRGLTRSPDTIKWTDNILDDLIEQKGGINKLNRLQIKGAVNKIKSFAESETGIPTNPPSIDPSVLTLPAPPPIKSPAVSSFITKAVEPLKSEAGRIPIENIVPGIETLGSVNLALERNKGRISRAFTRFSELDSPTTQAFINISEGDMELREKAAQAAIDLFLPIDPQVGTDIPGTDPVEFKFPDPVILEELYNHLQEPTKFPVPEGMSEIADRLRNIMKWSFKELNKLELTSDKDIAALENAVDNDLPIPDSLKPKLAVPKWPDNEIEALTKKARVLQLRLSATKDPDAALNYQSELATISARRDKLENVVYFHQISTKPGLHLRDRVVNRVISKKPKGLLGRKFATREDAQKEGFKTADLPTAVADVIYETNRSLMMDDFIKHINRNEDFAQRADLAPRDWVHIDKHKFPAGQFKKYHPAIADAVNEITYTSQKSDFGKAYDWVNTNAKMIGFYNPLFMTRFNITQGIRAGGLKTQTKLPTALRLWRAKGDTYNYLRRNGLFNNVFDLKPTMEDMTKGVMDQITGQKTLSKEFKRIAQKNLSPLVLARNTWKLLNEGTWKIDEVQRMATWLAMKDNPRLKRHYSDFEIIELVNDFHANYGKVPKASRQALNRVIFTPTYKISMARILGRMHREAPALWPSLLRHYAMKLAFTVGLPLAANEYLKSQGIDKRTKVEGYRFITSNPKSKKETVFSLSDPLLELTKIENRPFFRTIEFNLAAVPASTLNLIAGPVFRNKNDPEWKSTLDAFFKTGAPVVKELLLWQKDDLETYQKYMQGLGLAFIYKRNKRKLPEKEFRQTFLEALDLWVERKKLFPSGKLERRFVSEEKKLITIQEKKKKTKRGRP